MSVWRISRAELRGCRLGRASAANVFAVQKNRPVGDRMEKRSAKSERENGNAKNNTARLSTVTDGKKKTDDCE